MASKRQCKLVKGVDDPPKKRAQSVMTLHEKLVVLDLQQVI